MFVERPLLQGRPPWSTSSLLHNVILDLTHMLLSTCFSFCVMCLSVLWPFQVKLHFCYDPVLKSAVREDGKPPSFPFPGVLIWEDFLSKQEEEELVHEMDKNIWCPSQSGRKKQVVFYNQSTWMQHSICLYHILACIILEPCLRLSPLYTDIILNIFIIYSKKTN